MDVEVHHTTARVVEVEVEATSSVAGLHETLADSVAAQVIPPIEDQVSRRVAVAVAVAATATVAEETKSAGDLCSAGILQLADDATQARFHRAGRPSRSACVEEVQ
jgi:hypothetical protein